MFCLVLLFRFCFWFRIVSFPFLHTKAVESFKSQWKGTGLTPGLMSWCSKYLYVSLTWTAGILEICCSLRGEKKNNLQKGSGLAPFEPRQHIQQSQFLPEAFV